MDTSTQERHKKHALHNEEVYIFLKQRKDFIDWRITTAFYAALHFVEYKLFPLTITFAGKNKTLRSVEDYKEFFSIRSKHLARVHAVKNHINTCRAEFKDLFDFSMNARYRHYKFSNINQIDVKIEYSLKKIKKACI